MRPLKPLVVITLVITAWGTVHDVLAYGHFINGDDDEHTPPYIAMAAASAQSAVSTILINATTGGEIKVPPRTGTLTVWPS
jgi:hypothetical protein